jgi:hypothetical protein
VERRPLAGFGLDGDIAAVALDDALTERESDARPRVLVAGVEPLEELEDAVGVVRVDPDALVPDGDRRPRIPVRSAETVTRGGSSPLYSNALLTRFWNNWRNWSSSPTTRGNCSTSSVASLSRIRSSRSRRTSSSTSSKSTSWKLSPRVSIRDSSSNPSTISPIRSAPSTAYSRNSRPFWSRRSPYRSWTSER